MLRNSFVITFLFLFVISTSAQNIVRKGWLGVHIENLTAEDQKQLKLPNSSGAKVTQVVPGSTAEGMGIRAEDVIVSVDGTRMNNMSELISKAGTLLTGETIKVGIIRNSRHLTLEGKVVARPFETAKNGEVIYGEMPFLDGYIRTIINKPLGNGPFPAIFYLQGYTCNSIDNLSEDSPVKQMIEGLVAGGYAVFRMEKPGVGDSYNLPDCLEIDYKTEMDAFVTGLRHLKLKPFIDSSNIYLYGHSLGGIAAPLMAVVDKPRGIIVYGTVQKAWSEYMMDIFREQALLRSTNFAQVEQNSRTAFPLLNDLLIRKIPPAELAKNPEYNRLLRENMGFDGHSRVIGRHYTFWQQLQDRDLTEAWLNAGVHTLAIHGEADIHAVNHQDAKVIADIVNSVHPGRGKFIHLENTDHGMLLTGPMEENLKLTTAQRWQKPFNDKIVGILLEWMGRVGCD